mgnify:CR=1 FL=1
MAKSKSFEAELKKLQEIVAKLEGGAESLEESLKLFEEGTKIAKFCYEVLEGAEQKITNLSNTGAEADKKTSMKKA